MFSATKQMVDHSAFFDGFNHVPAINRLAERVRHDIDRLAREKCLLESVRRKTKNQAGPVSRELEETNWWSPAPPLPSNKDIQLHAWLTERLAVLHHERHDLWPRLRRFLFGNRAARWLERRRILPEYTFRSSNESSSELETALRSGAGLYPASGLDPVQ
jgi:hypothetical protein